MYDTFQDKSFSLELNLQWEFPHLYIFPVCILVVQGKHNANEYSSTDSIIIKLCNQVYFLNF